MMCSSNCARSNPARPLFGLLVWSLSIRRSAAATRSRARSKSATVAQFEGDDERWSAKLHASPRLPRLGSRSRDEYV
jgi:hypothetical protein